jgi:MoxR-like ATPase
MSHRPVAPLHDVDLPAPAALVDAVAGVLRGPRRTVELALAGVLARGHLLLEDVPGVGKTTLARALAAALGLQFRRIQFTADLLPSDILGVSVYDPRTGAFETRPGPIFAQLLLADEINRAPPRTQSALLEAMQEGKVTIDDRTLPLPQPFLVLATQNPLEHHGTYPLPESQLDRFLLRLRLGYPEAEAERELVAALRPGDDPVERMRPLLGPGGLAALQAAVDAVHVDPSVLDYLLAVVRATRSDPRLRLGASTRAAIALHHAARALAWVQGRTYVLPDDVRALLGPALGHRLLPADPTLDVELVLDELADAVPVPL